MRQKRIVFLLLAYVLMSLPVMAGSVSGETKQITIARGGVSITLLPFAIMEHHKLIEKHIKAVGLESVPVKWASFSGATGAIDALISGDLQFGSAGIPALAKLWEKTKGGIDVKGVAAMSAMPIYLNSKNKSIKTIQDLSEKDRIAVPAIKISVAAIVLQMAAAKAYGPEQYTKWDSLTVTLPNAVAAQALLSDENYVNAHFTAPPFSFMELKNPAVHTLTTSYEIMDGASTYTALMTTDKFRSKNPKTYAAVLSALEEAMDIIKQDKRAAAEIYLRVSGDKASVEDTYQLLMDPNIVFTTTPQNSMKYVDFMYEIGTLKERPSSWKELFFSEIHNLPGS